MPKQRLREFVSGGALSSAQLHANIVPDCKILGFTSRNGREYLREAVQKAVPLYEGKPVFFDHPKEGDTSRPTISRFGTFKNIKVKSDGLYGDLHFFENHLYAPTFRDWVNTDSNAVGFSHFAEGETRRQGGKEIVYEISGVESIDLVGDPATTNGIFESYQVETDVVPTDNGGEMGHEEHLAQAMVAIFKDSGMSPDDKKKKIMALLKFLDEPKAEEEEPKPKSEEDDEDKKETPESLKKELNRLRLENENLKLAESKTKLESHCKSLCAKQQLDAKYVSVVFLSSLLESKSDSDRVKLIQDRKSIVTPGVSPKSAGAEPNKALSVDEILNAFRS